jgi:hypothetical protein
LGKQCRERWCNHLDPTLKKEPWSEEEDRILRESQASMGNKWTKITELLPGRPENSIKNRWWVLRVRTRACKAPVLTMLTYPHRRTERQTVALQEFIRSQERQWSAEALGIGACRS